MTVTRLCFVCCVALVLGGCASLTPQKESPPLTPPKEAAVSPVVRERLPVEPAPPVQEAGPPAPALSQVPIPPTTLYVCAKLIKGEVQQVAIEFVPKVEQLCRRHPEMLPCQYERDICRRSGGRVFTADGTEITVGTETEYDKRVYRVRFRAD